MSATEPLINNDTRTFSVMATAWNRFEAALNKLGERLNPILVKEARQALKSRQFSITFAALLIAAWGWSIFGQLMNAGANGPQMFFVYYIILALPLTIVVPYSAYRSLAAEKEDGTYELLSITRLGPRQIVSGKLASAALQLIVYLSAVLPCLSFTYLLRGIDILTLVTLVVYVCAISMLLSMLAIFSATSASPKYRQFVSSVGLVLGFALAFFLTCMLAGQMIWEDIPVGGWEFWVTNGVLATAYGTYFVDLYLAAAAQLNFVSSNRSSALRIAVTVQFALCVAWFGWMWWNFSLVGGEYEAVPVAMFAALCSLHWYVVGVCTTGESPNLSRRVKRGLPRTLLGRALLSWMYPGPSTGYMLSTIGMVAMLILCGFAIATTPLGISAVLRQVLFNAPSPSTRNNFGVALTFAFCLTCYVIIYLGVGKLLLGIICRVSRPTMFARYAIHAFTLVTGCATPILLELAIHGSRNVAYSPLQFSNFAWTLTALISGVDFPAGGFSEVAPYSNELIQTLFLAALVVFGINLPAMAADIRQVGVDAPPRVAKEDQSRKATPPVEAIRTSPWDETPAA